MTEQEEDKKIFIDYIENFKQTYKQEEHENESLEDSVELMIKAVEKTIEMDIFINLNKIASHNNETFEQCVKGVKINRDDYSLGVVFNKIPSGEEISKVVACIGVLPLKFKVNYKAIELSENEKGDKSLNITNIKFKNE